MRDEVVFHRNERVMASSALQAEARAMLKGLLEADRRNIGEVKVIGLCSARPCG